MLNEHRGQPGRLERPACPQIAAWLHPHPIEGVASEVIQAPSGATVHANNRNGPAGPQQRRQFARLLAKRIQSARAGA
jgi:hypothetical protein